MGELPPELPRTRIAACTLLAWVAMIGVDFLVHAGVLARLYVEPQPFLLPPETAFRLIPLGYASLVFFAALLVWLAVRLGARGAAAGARVGLVLGGLLWAALTLGLASIATASYALLAGWLVGQTMQAAVGGAVIGAGLAAKRMGLVVSSVMALVVGCVVTVVVLQTMGLAPALRAGR